MTPDALSQAAADRLLAILGYAEGGQLMLLGPDEPRFWPAFQQMPEWQDGKEDPMDRWSARVITDWAKDLGGEALFPFGGPPYQPFYTWAVDSGRTWPSPVQFLVHDQAGLMVSFRGAIRLPQPVAHGATSKPCDSCAQPCTIACPVGALTDKGYDTDACHAYLDTVAGKECMTKGCLVRRACPVSQRFGRDSDQSAYHMGRFHR